MKHSKETKTKMSIAAKKVKHKNGKESSHWKGGHEATSARTEKVRRKFGFILLNDKFPGSAAHHLDKEFVVYIPKEMHESIWHSVIKDMHMEEINNVALDFVYGD